MKSGNVSGTGIYFMQNLPVGFTKRCIMPDTRMVTFQVAEISWPVKLKSYHWKSMDIQVNTFLK